jgi:hypothetical protein
MVTRRCRRRRLQAGLSGIGRSFRVLPRRSRDVLVGRKPLCRWHLPRLCGILSAGFADHLSATSRSLSSSFAFLSEPRTTIPSRPAAARQLLSWAFAPYSTSGFRGPLTAGSPARYVPPTGFGYPLDGLLPLSPCRFSFAPAALLGFTLRSFLLPEGKHGRFHPAEPTYRLACQYSHPPKRRGRPNRPRFLGFDPSRSPVTAAARLSVADCWMLPWVLPL